MCYLCNLGQTLSWVLETEVSREAWPGRAWSPSRALVTAQHEMRGSRRPGGRDAGGRSTRGVGLDTLVSGRVFCGESWVLSWGVKMDQTTDLKPGFFHTLPLSLAKLIQPRVWVSWISIIENLGHIWEATWVTDGPQSSKVRDQVPGLGCGTAFFSLRPWPGLSSSPVKREPSSSFFQNWCENWLTQSRESTRYCPSNAARIQLLEPTLSTSLTIPFHKEGTVTKHLSQEFSTWLSLWVLLPGAPAPGNSLLLKVLAVNSLVFVS